MPQLTGCHCVICSNQIDAESGARFCDGCGNSVHDRCAAKPGAFVRGSCADCGADLTRAAVVRSVDEQVKRPIPRDCGPYPVSTVCPRCQSAQHLKVKPEHFLAYHWDRVCTECYTRYTLPTPGWVGLVFVLVGVVLIAMSITGQLLYPFIGLILIARGINLVRSGLKV